MGALKNGVDAFRDMIEKFQRELGLPLRAVDIQEAESILSMSRGRLESMSASQAADAAYVLSQLALELQKRENGLNAFTQWCSANRNRIPDQCKSGFYELRDKAEQKKASIAYLARRVEFMSQTLMAVQRSRMKESA